MSIFTNNNMSQYISMISSFTLKEKLFLYDFLSRLSNNNIENRNSRPVYFSYFITTMFNEHTFLKDLLDELIAVNIHERLYWIGMLGDNLNLDELNLLRHDYGGSYTADFYDELVRYYGFFMRQEYGRRYFSECDALIKKYAEEDPDRTITIDDEPMLGEQDIKVEECDEIVNINEIVDTVRESEFSLNMLNVEVSPFERYSGYFYTCGVCQEDKLVSSHLPASQRVIYCKQCLNIVVCSQCTVEVLNRPFNGNCFSCRGVSSMVVMCLTGCDNELMKLPIRNEYLQLRTSSNQAELLSQPSWQTSSDDWYTMEAIIAQFPFTGLYISERHSRSFFENVLNALLPNFHFDFSELTPAQLHKVYFFFCHPLIKTRGGSKLSFYSARSISQIQKLGNRRRLVSTAPFDLDLDLFSGLFKSNNSAFETSSDVFIRCSCTSTNNCSQCLLVKCFKIKGTEKAVKIRDESFVVPFFYRWFRNPSNYFSTCEFLECGACCRFISTLYIGYGLFQCKSCGANICGECAGELASCCYCPIIKMITIGCLVFNLVWMRKSDLDLMDLVYI